MLIEWTKNLSVGVTEIDRQHQELFRRINGLITTMTPYNAKGEIMQVITYLEDYVLAHFNKEESYMTRYRYPDYQLHKSEHEEFIKDFTRLKGACRRDDKLIYLAKQTQRWLCEWWVKHVATVDNTLGVFLKTRL